MDARASGSRKVERRYRRKIDEAGNLWFTLAGESERALLIGGHIDSVPNGGWLDGCSTSSPASRCCGDRGGGHAAAHRPPRRLGRRGGRALRPVASSALRRGRLDGGQDELPHLTDARRVKLPDALAEHGVDLDRALDARAQFENAAAYLELHIEQGPVLEALDLPMASSWARSASSVTTIT